MTITELTAKLKEFPGDTAIVYFDDRLGWVEVKTATLETFGFDKNGHEYPESEMDIYSHQANKPIIIRQQSMVVLG